MSIYLSNDDGSTTRIPTPTRDDRLSDRPSKSESSRSSDKGIKEAQRYILRMTRPID